MMKLKNFLIYQRDPNKPRTLQQKALRLLLAFLGLMVLCTFLSRAADSLTVARIAFEKPSSMPIQHTLEASGRVEANGQVPVVLPSGLRVKEVEAKEGSVVKAGDVLFTLDLTEVRQELRKKDLEIQKQQLSAEQRGRNSEQDLTSAQRQLERAQEDYQNTLESSQLAVDRAEGDKNSAKKDLSQYEDLFGDTLDLYRDGDYLAPDDEDYSIIERHRSLKETFRQKVQAYNDALKAQTDAVNQARRGVEDAQLAIENAQYAEEDGKLAALELELARLDMQQLQQIVSMGGKVTAPEDGTVSAVSVTPGGLTGSEASALLVQSSTGLTFVVEVSDDSLKYFSKGDTAEVTFTGGSRHSSRDLKIDSIRAVAGRDKTSEIRVNLPPEAAEMGQSGDLLVRKKTQSYDTCVPLSALRSDGNQKYVLVIGETTTVLGTELVAQRVDVTVLDQNETHAAVSGGLWRDERVITSSSKNIQAGDRVRLEAN